MKSDRISVLIAYPSTMTGELLASAVKRHADFHVAAFSSSVEEILETIQSTALDVALISATLAGDPAGGLHVLKQIHERCPKLKSVMLLDRAEPTVVVDAFRAGAKGVFCSSQFEFKMLCKCVKRVHEGQIWISSIELAYVMAAFSKPSPIRVMAETGPSLLSRREQDVVKLLAEGLQNSEIAQKLNLSAHTVKNYLFRIFDKLGVSTRVELALYAVSNVKRQQVAQIEAYEPKGELQIASIKQSTQPLRMNRCSTDHCLVNANPKRDTPPTTLKKANVAGR